jgi:hypothetical protein
VKSEVSSSISESTAGEEPISEPEIAALAYFYWQQQGCPFPTSREEAWRRAERELREQCHISRGARAPLSPGGSVSRAAEKTAQAPTSLFHERVIRSFSRSEAAR